MEEDYGKINLEDKYKGALRKAKEVREDVHKRNNGCEPSIAECLAYDMQYVEQYVEHLITRNKELEVENFEKEYWKSQYFDQVKYGNRITLQGDSVSNVIDIIKKDYIPKSKLRELLKEIDEANSDEGWWYENKIKELLGEED